MKIIGITGRSGSGKSYITSLLCKSVTGSIEIDCDKIYNEKICVLPEFLAEIKNEFGDKAIQSHKLNKDYLRDIVFCDNEKLKKLNTIAHKYVTLEVKNTINNQNCDYAFINAPQLFESGLNLICDKTIAVITTPETEIKRIVSRDNISPKKATERLSNQFQNEYFRENCDFIFENNDENADITDLINYIERI